MGIEEKRHRAYNKIAYVSEHILDLSEGNLRLAEQHAREQMKTPGLHRNGKQTLAIIKRLREFQKACTD